MGVGKKTLIAVPVEMVECNQGEECGGEEEVGLDIAQDYSDHRRGEGEEEERKSSKYLSSAKVKDTCH